MTTSAERPRSALNPAQLFAFGLKPLFLAVLELSCPKPHLLKDLTISRLDTADDWVRGRNERSLIVAISIRGHRLLFLGGYRYRSRTGPGSALRQESDYRKVLITGAAAHRVLTSSRGVSAKVALIGAGPNDRFGHPHRDIVQRWRDSGGRVGNCRPK